MGDDQVCGQAILAFDDHFVSVVEEHLIGHVASPHDQIRRRGAAQQFREPARVLGPLEPRPRHLVAGDAADIVPLEIWRPDAAVLGKV